MTSCLLCISCFLRKTPTRQCTVIAASFIHVPDVLHLLSRDNRPKTFLPRVHCNLWQIIRFPTEFVLRKVVTLFKSLRVASFVAAFVVNSWIIGPSIGFLLEPVPFTSEYCEVWLPSFALENPLNHTALLQDISQCCYMCFSTTNFLSKFAHSWQSFAILRFFNDLKMFF